MVGGPPSGEGQEFGLIERVCAAMGRMARTGSARVEARWRLRGRVAYHILCDARRLVCILEVADQLTGRAERGMQLGPCAYLAGVR